MKALAMLRDVRIQAQRVDSTRFTVTPGQPTAQQITIEPDASAMSYALTAAVLTRSTVRIDGIGKGSAQGDLGLLQAYARMGCKAELCDNSVTLTGAALNGIEIDMKSMPDVVLSRPSAPPKRLPQLESNIANLRVKECDRIAIRGLVSLMRG